MNVFRSPQLLLTSCCFNNRKPNTSILTRLRSYLLAFKPFSPHIINSIVRASGSSHHSRRLACQQTVRFSVQGRTADGMKLCCWIEVFETMVLSQPCSHLLAPKMWPVPKSLGNVLTELSEDLLGRQQRKAGYYLVLLLLWYQGLNLIFFFCVLLAGW